MQVGAHVEKDGAWFYVDFGLGPGNSRCSVKEGGILGGKPCPPDTPNGDFWLNFARFGTKAEFLTKFLNDSAWFCVEKLKNLSLIHI